MSKLQSLAKDTAIYGLSSIIDGIEQASFSLSMKLKSDLSKFTNIFINT